MPAERPLRRRATAAGAYADWLITITVALSDTMNLFQPPLGVTSTEVVYDVPGHGRVVNMKAAIARIL